MVLLVLRLYRLVSSRLLCVKCLRSSLFVGVPAETKISAMYNRAAGEKHLGIQERCVFENGERSVMIIKTIVKGQIKSWRRGKDAEQCDAGNLDRTMTLAGEKTAKG